MVPTVLGVARRRSPQITGFETISDASHVSTQLKHGKLNLPLNCDACIIFSINTFDAVINVESSHCYGNMKKFLNEVYRVLKKGGHFTWVDLRGKDMVRDTESAFEGVNLKCIHEQTITSEVIQALDGIHERKMQMIKLHVPKFLQSAFKDFAGVKKSKIYNAFNDGNAVYLAKAFQKS